MPKSTRDGVPSTRLRWPSPSSADGGGTVESAGAVDISFSPLIRGRVGRPAAQIRGTNVERGKLQRRSDPRVAIQPEQVCACTGNQSAPAVLGERLIGHSRRVGGKRPLDRQDLIWDPTAFGFAIG